MIIACVRVGRAYTFDYVTKLRNMVARHCKREYELVCFTDQPDRCEGVTFIDTSQTGLQGWWAKMLIFEPAWRKLKKVVYVDLDTIIIRDMTPLADVPGEFSILQSPVRLTGNTSYPCKYNSSVMVIGGGMAAFVWAIFDRDRHIIMRRNFSYGDQRAIEDLYPNAPFLQTLLPDFFCNYRYLTNHMPKAASIINFGGSHKPHNCPIPWVQAEWCGDVV